MDSDTITYYLKKYTRKLAHIEGLISQYKNIIEDPHSTKIDDWGYTNRRWSSYEEAPINDLLKINIPIYAIFATGDESTPIVNSDHSYREKKDGQIKDNWPTLFKKFIEWTK